MTPVFFIILVSVILSLLVFWILNTIQNTETAVPPKGAFSFESAAELGMHDVGEFYLAQNNIKIQLCKESLGLVYWNLDKAKWEEACAVYGIKPDIRRIVLRVNEMGEKIHYSDMWVGSFAGQYRFRLEAHKTYYVSLGVKYRRRFIPIITSNSIIQPS